MKKNCDLKARIDELEKTVKMNKIGLNALKSFLIHEPIGKPSKEKKKKESYNIYFDLNPTFTNFSNVYNKKNFYFETKGESNTTSCFFASNSRRRKINERV